MIKAAKHKNQVSGIVYHIERARFFGRSGFKKQLIVIERKFGRNAHYLPIEFCQQNVRLLEGVKLGDQVLIDLRLTGRKWQNKQHQDRFALSAEGVHIEKFDDTPSNVEA